MSPIERGEVWRVVIPESDAGKKVMMRELETAVTEFRSSREARRLAQGALELAYNRMKLLAEYAQTLGIAVELPPLPVFDERAGRRAARAKPPNRRASAMSGPARSPQGASVPREEPNGE